MALVTIYLLTREDVIDRFGGAEWLTQALDPHQTGTYDTAILDRARADASGDLMAAAGNRVKLWTEPGKTDVPQWVITLAARRAVVYCWDYGTHGKTRPEMVQRFYDETEAALTNLRDGKTGTGYGEPATRTNPRPSPIDNSDSGRRMVYGSFRRSLW